MFGAAGWNSIKMRFDLKKCVVLSVPYETEGDVTGRIGGRDWDLVKDDHADYLINTIAAKYVLDLKAKILKREAHAPLGIERKISSALRGTICHTARLPY